MLILPEKFRLVLPTLRFGKRQLIFILALMVLLTLASLFLFGKVKKEGPPGVAAKVGDEKIAIATVNQFASDCKVSQKEAVFYLVDEKVLSLWTLDEKIVISPPEQEAEEIRIAGFNPPNQACVSLEARVNLLRQKLAQNLTQFKEGKFIVANFDHYNPNPFLPLPGITTEEEREKLLKEERTYADQLIASVYSDLKENKLTFDEALEKVQKDKMLGLKSLYQTSPQSGQFSASDYIERRQLLADELVRQKVDSLFEGQFSAPFIQKASLTPCGEGDPGCQPQYVDARWIIIKVERIGKGYASQEEELLGETREKYGAEVYLE